MRGSLHEEVLACSLLLTVLHTAEFVDPECSDGRVMASSLGRRRLKLMGLSYPVPPSVVCTHELDLWLKVPDVCGQSATPPPTPGTPGLHVAVAAERDADGVQEGVHPRQERLRGCCVAGRGGAQAFPQRRPPRLTVWERAGLDWQVFWGGATFHAFPGFPHNSTSPAGRTFCAKTRGTAWGVRHRRR